MIFPLKFSQDFNGFWFHSVGKETTAFATETDTGVDRIAHNFNI